VTPANNVPLELLSVLLCKNYITTLCINSDFQAAAAKAAFKNTLHLLALKKILNKLANKKKEASLKSI